MINLEEHKLTVVHCPTEDLIREVEDQIVNLGGRRLWDEEAKNYIIKNKNQPNGMCFGLGSVSRGANAYCDLEYYKKAHYLIISAQEFLQLCEISTIINNYEIY